jgi:hypothetical protein
MDGQTIDKLIALLRDLSPALLAAGRNQVFAQEINSAIGIVCSEALGIGCVVSLWWLLRWARSCKDEPTRDIVGVIGTVVIIALLLISFVMATSNVNNLVNYFVAPDYYTIKAIFSLAK